MLDSQPIQVERSAAAVDLVGSGFGHLCVPHESKELAWSCARDVFREAAREDAVGTGMPPSRVVGEFTVPPRGARCRDFQALHMDYAQRRAARIVVGGRQRA